MAQTEEMLSVNRRERMKLPGIPKPYRDPEVRILDFAEASPGYDAAAAQAEAARCIHCPDPAPCVEACPLGNDIPSALWYIEQGDFVRAAEIYRQTSPMPEICGRVCPPDSTCMAVCSVGKRGEAIHTSALEQFAADYQRKTSGVPLPEIAPPTGKHVAVVGAGPAGLAAAEKLRVAGHAVTVYEAWPEAGGLLMYGIPGFKLDKSVVRWKVDWLRDLGVEFKTGVEVGRGVTVDELLAQGFDAIFLGIGTRLEASMKVPGEDLEGVYTSIDFLSRANAPQELMPPDKRDLPEVGSRLAVIGGGDTATDCLRTGLRLGADEVVCYYRRSEAEMPGNADERAHAEEEGARFVYLTAPVAFLDSDGDGRVDEMEMIQMELGEPDESGRRRPVPIEGSEYRVPVSSVALAIGYWPDPLLGETTPGLETRKWGLIVAEEETGATSRPEIWAGGDAVTGPKLVGEAVAAGLRAAEAINEYLADGG
jgi:glutamate synthase (NADPH/NADH) small chain